MTPRTPKFYAVLSRMKYITRWALMRNTRPENICEHSQDVAVLAHAPGPADQPPFRRPGGCLPLRPYRSVSRHARDFTGDLPTPVKYYNPAIRDAYKQVEDVAADKLLSLLPADLREDYAPLLRPGDEWAQEKRIVKAADKLAGPESNAWRSWARGTANLPPPAPPPRRRSGPWAAAADCFLEDSSPAFSLTLDEQDA